MKVYLVINDHHVGEQHYTRIHGVYSTMEKALTAIDGAKGCWVFTATVDSEDLI